MWLIIVCPCLAWTSVIRTVRTLSRISWTEIFWMQKRYWMMFTSEGFSLKSLQVTPTFSNIKQVYTQRPCAVTSDSFLTGVKYSMVTLLVPKRNFDVSFFHSVCLKRFPLSLRQGAQTLVRSDITWGTYLPGRHLSPATQQTPEQAGLGLPWEMWPSSDFN